ncbi:MAG: hypothetical protein V7731_00660 [Amphritea sp.]
MTTNTELPQPHNSSPKVVFVDMENVLSDYSGAHAKAHSKSRHFIYIGDDLNRNKAN